MRLLGFFLRSYTCSLCSESGREPVFSPTSLAIKRNVSVENNLCLFKGCSVIIGTRDTGGKGIRPETLPGKGCLWKGLPDPSAS